MEEGAAGVHTAVLLSKDKPRAEEVEADYVGVLKTSAAV